MSVNALPFLRWAGGKRWLAERVAERIRPRLDGATYIEPFLGGGAMYFALAPKERAILSDNNAELIETYKTLRASYESVAKELASLPVSEPDYYRIRDSERPRSKVGRAARFIYLNRTCYAGIYRTNQDGVFNVPYGGGDRSAKKILEGGILASCARILRETRQLDLVTRDFESSIGRALEGDVVYADPCYRGSARIGYDRYGPKAYSFEDQKRLAKCLFAAHEKGALVLLSTQTTEGFEQLVKAGLVLTLWRRHGLTQPGKQQTGKELLIVLDPKHELARWEPLSDFNVKLNGKHRSDPAPIRARSNQEIIRRAVCKAAQDPLNGKVGPNYKQGEKRDALNHFHSEIDRAKMNGIGRTSQYYLDQIARLRPELLTQIADGSCSILGAYRLCKPAKSVTGLSRLRRAWSRATEKERAIFRAEID
jgi:DNA adenine methylase